MFVSGLAGSNDLDNAEISSLVEVVEDVWVRIAQFFFSTDEQKKVRLSGYDTGKFTRITTECTYVCS